MSDRELLDQALRAVRQHAERLERATADALTKTDELLEFVRAAQNRLVMAQQDSLASARRRQDEAHLRELERTGGCHEPD